MAARRSKGSPGRGLGDVFDYFVSPEEQAQARGRSAATGSAARRWLLALDVARPRGAALAVDLAAALTRDGREAVVLADLARPRFAPVARGVRWQAIDEARAFVETLAEHDDRHVLVSFAPAALGDVLRELAPPRVEGLVFVVEATRSGLARALGQLRQAQTVPALRIATLLFGGDPSDEAFRSLERAASRQLSRPIESLGALVPHRTVDRALLTGRTLLESDPDCAAAHALCTLGERLGVSAA